MLIMTALLSFLLLLPVSSCPSKPVDSLISHDKEKKARKAHRCTPDSWERFPNL
jgi:hypothetical protein